MFEWAREACARGARACGMAGDGTRAALPLGCPRQGLDAGGLCCVAGPSSLGRKCETACTMDLNQNVLEALVELMDDCLLVECRSCIPLGVLADLPVLRERIKGGCGRELQPGAAAVGEPQAGCCSRPYAQCLPWRVSGWRVRPLRTPHAAPGLRRRQPGLRRGISKNREGNRECKSDAHLPKELDEEMARPPLPPSARSSRRPRRTGRRRSWRPGPCVGGRLCWVRGQACAAGAAGRAPVARFPPCPRTCPATRQGGGRAGARGR